MENNANEENPFQDLLSAALSESGLTDDFDLSGLQEPTYNAPAAPQTPVQTYSPVVRHVSARAQPTLRAAVQGTVPGRPVHAVPRGQPIVLSSSQASQLINPGTVIANRPGLPQAASTLTSSKGKKSIIHIVTPKNLSSVATQGQSGATVKRVIQLQPSSSAAQRPASPSIVQQQPGGNIKVIQVAASKPNTSSQNTVTLSGGDGKTYKIVTIKSGGATGSQDGTAHRIVVTSATEQSSSNIVRTLVSTPNSNLGGNIVKASGIPLTRTIATTVQGQGGAQTFKVLSSGATGSNSPVTQIGTSSSGQPIIIRTPSRTGDGSKTVTKVLKIIKPTVQSSTRTDQDKSQPQVIRVAAQPVATLDNKALLPSAGSRPTIVTASGTLSSSSQISKVVTINKSGGDLQASSGTVQAQKVTIVSKAETPNETTTKIPASLPVSKLQEVTSAPVQVLTSAPSTSTMSMDSVNEAPVTNLSTPSQVSVTSRPSESVSTPAKAPPLSGTVMVSPLSDVQSVADPDQTPGASQTATVVAPSGIADTVAKVETPDVATNVTVPTSEPMETSDKPTEPAAPVEQSSADMDWFGGGDLDLFSQALAQLSETNKKAKEFEDQHKQDTPEPPKKMAPKPIAPATPQPQPQPIQVQSTIPSASPAPLQTASSVPTVLRHVISGQDPPSGRSSPSLFQLVQPGRGQSPVSIVARSGSPLTVGRPNSPQIVRIQGQTSLLRSTAIGQPTTVQTLYTQPGTPLSAGEHTSSLRRIISMPQLQDTPTSQYVRRVIPGSGGRVSYQHGAALPGAPKVVVGSINQMSTPGGIAKTVAGNGTIPTVLTDKVVSQMWSNDDLNLKKITSTPNMLQAHSTNSVMMNMASEEEMEAETEELGRAETYEEYMPTKLKVGQKHPDPVVESSSLSSVEPPNVFYKLSIPEVVIDSRALSALQLETITYASQKHAILLPSGERAGFLVGDGAGVGKGRTIAGMIYENYLQGRKRAIWLSVSNDLKVDAERDLCDIGASKIEVHPLNKFKYAKISSHINGSVKKGVIFATYSSLIGESHSGGKYRTRFKQLLHWCGKDFDGVIVFDECHRAKNLCPVGSSKPTKTGQTVLELQSKLPKARIVYASATGASEPRNMAYMTRLGLWGLGTPFREFMDFIQAIEKRGVGAMELVAMDMKLRGMYIARQLSFHGVSFKVDEIPVPKDFVTVYNESVALWVDARSKFQLAVELISAEQRMRKTMWGQFWSAHQRFFKYLCISAKVRHCVKLARDAVKNGKCVVIGLQSTGEARTLEQLEESGGELNDFVSTAKGVLQTLVDKHFPAPDRQKTMGLFGWSSNIFESTPSPKSKLGSKRKKKQNEKNNKKTKMSFSDDDDSSSSDSEPEEQKKKSPSVSEASDLSLSESSEDSDSDSDMDEDNPFGAGSDSDDDPWLRKASKKKEKKKKKGPKEDKKVKVEEKKKKKKKKEKKTKGDSDSDEFDDIDSQLDKVLMAAGVKSRENDKVSAGLNNAKIPAKDSVEQAIDMKRELLNSIEELGDSLPPNPLDQLIDQLGGPECVAEMTGRKGRVVSTDNGMVQYESRSETDTPLELMNLAEKQRFMNGEKNIAIISEAASSGISLQADRRVINQRRRVHITLELPWSADRAIQQFGRTHRSNQVSAPEYVFLISQLAGERRFASTVAKRLESLGALTHGDRRATESRDLSRFNFDNKFGRTALEAVMKSVLQMEVPLVQPPETYTGEFFRDVKRGLVGVGMIAVDERTGYAVLEKEYNNISKFLNRILGMEVAIQNALFQYFTETLAAVILQAKRNGRWDMGILDLGTSGECVQTLSTKNFQGNFSGSNTTITLFSVSVERGLSWPKALDIWREYEGEQDGFYVSIHSHNSKKPPILAISMVGRKRGKLFRVYRPNSGLQGKMETLDEIKQKYKKVFPNDARMWWEDQYDSSETICTHAYWRGSCRRALAGMTCETGLRTRRYHLLSGSVLSVWNKVESVLASTPGGLASRMQIIRLRTDDGKRIVGTLIPEAALPHLEQMLSNSVAESPHKLIPYMPYTPKPVVVRPTYTSLPAHLDYRSASSSPRASPPPTPTQPLPQTPTSSKPYLSMPMFL